MRILVTRPAEEGERLARLLRERGHESILSPAMDIQLEDGPDLSFETAQAILVTSANGVRALAQRTRKRNVPLFVVGPQTAEAARSAGFVSVRDAKGDSRVLAQNVRQWAFPGGGSLVYAAGDAITDDLVCTLLQQGFDVEVLRLYRANERAMLSDTAAAGLASDAIDAVMLFSPRSARAFVRQVLRAGLQKNCEKILALCISPAAAAALFPLHFAHIQIAAEPNRNSMLDMLG
ncbi:MAG TPA: uroporphyrinogen-III synthase [Rhizomicrobium sp.]|nr:uroporphyrinogen-III synthase [Rhizomicrobium sp.]